MAEQTGTWVRKGPETERHECETPRKKRYSEGWDVVGNPGDLWRCECGRLWHLIEVEKRYTEFRCWRKVWVRATLWQRLRYWKSR